MDDDAIVVVDSQQPLGVRASYWFDMRFGSDSKWLEINTLEMVDQTGIEPVTS